MPSELTDEQNAIARTWLRQLMTQATNQSQVADKLGVSQGTVSQLTKAGSERGTTASVFITAGRLLGVPHDEIARRLGLDVGSGMAAPFSNEFLEACPPNLRKYLTAARTTLQPNVAKQLFRVFEVDRVDRDPAIWRALAHLLVASSEAPSEVAEEEIAAPSSGSTWNGGDEHRSSRKVRVSGKR